MKISKTMILPILSVLAMLAQILFGVQISQDLLNELAQDIVNLVLVIVSIWGIYKTHTK